MSNPEAKEVHTIPVERITVLNPRVRNKRNFEDMVESIRRVGLKRPVTVTRLEDDHGQPAYGLVCGQGRLEACKIGRAHV